MKFPQLFHETVDSLQHAGIEDAQSDAVQLLDYCFGISRSQLFLSKDRDVPHDKLDRFRELLQRRLAREPLQYITGLREFWSRDFYVSPSVLIPRPETEFLLDRTLSICRKYDWHPHTVLDMCTGSGVIAIVLAYEIKAQHFVAVDRSSKALQLAAKNREKHAMVEKIDLICSDLFSALAKDEQFDLIVSNPPYVATGDYEELQPEVKSWEPGSALLAGEDGLDVIVQLADKAHEYLSPAGWIFIEIGADQKDSVEQLFMNHSSGAYEEVKVVADWSGRPRVLQARKVRRIDE